MELYSGSGSPSTITTKYDWTNYDFYKLRLVGDSNWGVNECRFFTAEEFMWGAYEGSLSIKIYGGRNTYSLCEMTLTSTSNKSFSVRWFISYFGQPNYIGIAGLLKK